MKFTKETPKEVGWYWLTYDREYWPGLPDEVQKPLMVVVYKEGSEFWFKDTINHEEYEADHAGRLWAGPLMPEEKPIDMLLWCPLCKFQHVDEPQPEKNWHNPPHRSHECQSCGYVWRPADVPTNGVAKIQTMGQRDQDPTPH